MDIRGIAISELLTIMEPRKKSFPSVWEILLWVFLFLLLVPHTVGSAPFEWLLLLVWSGLYEGGIIGALSDYPYYGILYVFGAGWLIYLMLLFLIALGTQLRWSPSIQRAQLAVFLLGGLYLWDFFTSTADPYPYEEAFWVFYPFIVFFTILLLADKSQSVRLINILLIILGLQSIYAIVYYLIDYKQFYTPHFGNRTGGTFGDPNILYPLCLMGVPLSLTMALSHVSKGGRLFYWIVAFLCFFALFFTYTRTGWLALIPALVLLLFHPQSPFSGQSRWKWIITALALLIFILTLFVRSRGEVAGAASDRSFWGRPAIWGVALSSIPEQFWWGHGVSTYNAVQKRYITDHLKTFNPMNVEPKNLYLHLTVERGILGLILLFAVMGFSWRSFQTSKCPLETRAINVGLLASLLTILCAGVSDTPILNRTRFAPTVVVAALLAVSCVLLNCKQYNSVVEINHLSERQRRFWRRFQRGGLLMVVLMIAGWAYMRWVVWQFSPQIIGLQSESKESSFVRLNQISPQLIDCFIASEDSKFYLHKGVDWTALHRALRANIRSLRFVQGGSTITMQTARYLCVGRQRTPLRKLAEIAVALEMERCLSKPKILELYANCARFGLGAEDVGKASEVYFGKKPIDLTLSESAFLAGVLPEPPSSPEELSSEKIARCVNRTLQRLPSFSGNRYDPFTIENARKDSLKIAFKREKP